MNGYSTTSNCELGAISGRISQLTLGTSPTLGMSSDPLQTSLPLREPCLDTIRRLAAMRSPAKRNVNSRSVQFPITVRKWPRLIGPTMGQATAHGSPCPYRGIGPKCPRIQANATLCPPTCPPWGTSQDLRLVRDFSKTADVLADGRFQWLRSCRFRD